MTHIIDVKFYPGWTRKAITFSIDDGILDMDRKFMDIVEPYGIKGAFNLCSERLNQMSPEEYREFYRGHEIANHCKYHPAAFIDGCEYEIAKEKFDPASADPSKLYHYEGEPGLYHAVRPWGGWMKRADTDAFIRLIEESHSELEAIFGEGSIRAFVWPYIRQDNKRLTDYVSSIPHYYSERLDSCVGVDPKIYFAPPDDHFFYLCARQKNLLTMAESFESLPDDGKLKFFCFGVHSIDYEKSDKWGDLLEFAKTYGARPEDYFYATIAEIYDYAKATKSVEITDTEIKNPTKIDLYIKIDGRRHILKAGRSIRLEDN